MSIYHCGYSKIQQDAFPYFILILGSSSQPLLASPFPKKQLEKEKHLSMVPNPFSQGMAFAISQHRSICKCFQKEKNLIIPSKSHTQKNRLIGLIIFGETSYLFKKNKPTPKNTQPKTTVLGRACSLEISTNPPSTNQESISSSGSPTFTCFITRREQNLQLNPLQIQ